MVKEKSSAEEEEDQKLTSIPGIGPGIALTEGLKFLLV